MSPGEEIRPAYTNKEGIAKYLGVSISTVQRWMNRRAIPWCLIAGKPHFKFTDVDQALKTNFQVAPIRSAVPPRRNRKKADEQEDKERAAEMESTAP